MNNICSINQKWVREPSLDPKDNLKKAIAEDCKKDNKMTDKQLEKFAFVFDRIQEIIDAEKEGKTNI